MSSPKRLPKHIWLPALLAIYFIAMMIAFVPELYKKGEYTRIIIVSGVEIIVILLCYLFYKHREKLRNK